MKALALAAGAVVGVVLAAAFAPASGEETRRRIASACLDAIESANQLLWRYGFDVSEKLNRSQLRISHAVGAGRGALAKSKSVQSPVEVL